MLTIIFTLAIIGLIVWLILTYVPMPEVFKTVITIIVVIFAVLLLFQALGHPIGPRISLW